MQQQLSVTAADQGRRLDVVLADRLGDTRSQWQRRLRQQQVSLNGQPVKANLLVEPGQTFVIGSAPATAVSASPPNIPVIFQDGDVLVLDKPAGLAMHAGVGTGATVADFVRPLVQDDDAVRPGIVHRLDKDTSGALIVAKHPQAKDWLQSQFRRRQVRKTYLALVQGRLMPPEAVIDLPLSRDRRRPTRRAVQAAGKPAQTHYRVLEYLPGASLVEAEPLTGRTHQLRVHLAAVGHPIIGDVTYNPAARPKALGRQFLHAAQLKLTLPNGQLRSFTSQLPADLEVYLHSLRAAV